MQSKLLVGEEIRWTGTPNSTCFLIDLTYKGLMWWSVFALIVPIYGSSLELTALLVLMLTWLEFKKQWNGRVYFITDTRAICADKTRKGQWVFTDYPLAELISTKQTAILKSLVMQFRTVHSVKTLKFLYLADTTQAQRYLSVNSSDPFLTVPQDVAPGKSDAPQSLPSPTKSE